MNLLRVLPASMSCFAVILFFNGCEDKDCEEIVTDCGCRSETFRSIPDQGITDDYGISLEEQKMGLLFFKKPERIDGISYYNFYDNRFWVFQGTEGCYNCQRRHIVCNEDFLGGKYDSLKNVDDSIAVKFTGDLKSLCEEFIKPADYFYAELVLTSIEPIEP